MKEICPTCGAAVDVGSVGSMLATIGGGNLTVRCPACSTEIALAARDPEPYDPGPIDDADPLAPWHRDRARGIPVGMLPRYDHDRATWTVYDEDVPSYATAIARIDNVKAGLTPDGSFDEVGASLDEFLTGFVEPYFRTKAAAGAWGVDIDDPAAV